MSLSLKIGCLRNSNKYGSNRKVQVHAYNVSVSLAFPLIVIKSPKAFHVKPAHKHTNIMSVNQFAFNCNHIILQDARQHHVQDLFSEWVEGESVGECNRYIIYCFVVYSQHMQH